MTTKEICHKLSLQDSIHFKVTIVSEKAIYTPYSTISIRVDTLYHADMSENEIYYDTEKIFKDSNVQNISFGCGCGGYGNSYFHILMENSDWELNYSLSSSQIYCTKSKSKDGKYRYNMSFGSIKNGKPVEYHLVFEKADKDSPVVKTDKIFQQIELLE